MRPSIAGSRAALARLALAFALGVGGCAPHEVTLPPLGALEGAYRDALGRREALGRALDAEITLWGRPAGSGAWPAATAGLSLAAPDRVRLHVASLFGTAFDGVARGDSIVAHLPGRRIGVVADAARDPLGVRRPGSLGFRVFTAAWRPPAAAWAAGTVSGPRLTLRWREEGDTLRLTVGPDGLPERVSLAGGDSLWVEARYAAWTRQRGTDWPASIEFRGADGKAFARCKVGNVWFHEQPDESRLVVRLPAGTDVLDWPGFVRALRRAREM